MGSYTSQITDAEQRNSLISQLVTDQSRLKSLISQQYLLIKTQANPQHLFSRLHSLKEALHAVQSLLRATQKNNFMLLNTLYDCPDL